MWKMDSKGGGAQLRQKTSLFISCLDDQRCRHVLSIVLTMVGTETGFTQQLECGGGVFKRRWVESSQDTVVREDS